MSATILVAGASGFVGVPLTRALTESGHRVRAMTRSPDRYSGSGEPVYGDAGDPVSLVEAFSGVDAAYYLVHSLDVDDFEATDAQAALNVGAAAAAAGVERIVYLGGLGRDGDDLSAHLRSRREVEQLLARSGVPVTVLRAAVVIGHGGISWEITRQLVDHLHNAVTPTWVNTRTQPIALRDVIRYLVGVLEPAQARGRVFEIGGPDVLTYLDMLRRAADVQGRHVHNLSVPLISSAVSSAWLSLVTDVDSVTARNLVDSMMNEMVVTDPSIRDVVPGPTLGYDAAVRIALADRAQALGRRPDRSMPDRSTPR